jgi:hypothetical protein
LAQIIRCFGDIAAKESGPFDGRAVNCNGRGSTQEALDTLTAAQHFEVVAVGHQELPQQRPVLQCHCDSANTDTLHQKALGLAIALLCYFSQSGCGALKHGCLELIGARTETQRASAVCVHYSWCAHGGFLQCTVHLAFNLLHLLDHISEVDARLTPCIFHRHVAILVVPTHKHTFTADELLLRNGEEQQLFARMDEARG